MDAEAERLRADAFRLELEQQSAAAVQRMRHQSRLPDQYEARNLFNTPGTGRNAPLTITQTAEVPGSRAAVQHRQPDPPRRNQTPPQHFPTPPGHYSNPVENMIAAAARLNALPLAEGTPFAGEARNAIGYLQTAVAQQEKYTYSRSSVHSTPIPSRSYSQRLESPAVSSSERRRKSPQVDQPALDAQVLVDRARVQRETAALVAAAAYQEPTVAPSVLVGAGVTSRAVGVPCLVPALRNERLPKDFKGPRKVPNYTADMELAEWIEIYELAMDMMEASDVVCARYLPLMLEGPAHTWLKNLHANSINTWQELKEHFIKNF